MVGVGAVLEAMAGLKADHGGKYRTSIGDLLKLLDLNSALAECEEVGEELDLHVGADGTAEQNIALHCAVMEKLAGDRGHCARSSSRLTADQWAAAPSIRRHPVIGSQVLGTPIFWMADFICTSKSCSYTR